MARELIDGFEAGLTLMAAISGSAALVSTTGLNLSGDYCLNLPISSDSVVDYALVADDEKYFAFKYRTNTLTQNAYMNRVMFLYKGANIIFQLRRNTTSYKLEAYVETTLVATGTTALGFSTTHLIEVRVKVADSGGIIQVKLNGVLDIDYSGDTKPGTNTQFDILRIAGTGSAYAHGWWDDLVVDDAAWIGDTKIQGIRPTAAGNAAQWTPSAGANFQCVDEVPPDDADYVETNTAAILDTHGFGDLVGSIESIKCVQVHARSVKEGAPTPQNLQLAVRSGATDYFSGNKAVPAAAPKGLFNIWETDPNTAAAWLASGVNAAEFGYKAVA
jgi:hypothetical protein